MREGALNQKLQKLLASIGVFGRNTYYSLRRAAIIEVRRRYGTEAARQLANHTPDSNAIGYYDTSGMSDVDMTAYRSGDAPDVSRDDLRTFFSQAADRINPKNADGQTESDPKAVLEKEINRQLKEDPEYFEGEAILDGIFSEATEKLLECRNSGQLPTEIVIPLGHVWRKASILDELLRRCNLIDLVSKLSEELQQRKLRHRRIRNRLRPAIMDQMQKDNLILVEAVELKSDKGGQSMVRIVEAQTTPAPMVSEDDDLNDDIDEEALERAKDAEESGNRSEPECWQG